MKVVRIDDADKISFDNLKAEFKNQFSKHPGCDISLLSTLKDSCFLNLMLELWENTPYEEIIQKLSDSQIFQNYKK